MKFNVVALFAASAIAAVLPEEPAYPEAPAYPEVPEVPATTEAAYPEAPETTAVATSSEEASPEPTTEISSVVITSTVCTDEASETPGGEYPEETPSTSAEDESPVPTSSEDASPEPTVSVCEPVVYEKTITTSYTTVIPTTIVETYTEECALPTGGEEEYPQPTGTGTGPSGPIESVPAGNSTTPEGEYPEEPVVAGASAVFGSVFTVAAAAVAAFAFA